MNYSKKSYLFLPTYINDTYLKTKSSSAPKEKTTITGPDFFGFNRLPYVIYIKHSLLEYSNITTLKMKLMTYIIRIALKIGIMLHVILFV